MSDATADVPSVQSLHDRLLVAAVAEIDDVGIDRASLRSIARRAEVSHQAPGHLFKNKTGLLTTLAVRVIRLLGSQMSEARSAAHAAGTNGKDLVVAIGAAYIQFAVSRPALFALISRSEMLDHTMIELRESLDTTWQVLTSAVRDAQAEGWRSDQPVEDVALMCWSIVHGLAAIQIGRLQPTELRDHDAVELIHSVAGLL
ncbi:MULTISPECIES: TetR/AcrR family transcriptional regulator [Nocardia]|jgi:AcrR family transcriptional regulator|uniref:TetR/AcrR family transcriptional regulator n=1 Tax=Nocardia TaxID=1817 RepID=UPI001C4EDFB7|nr:MULTISPECIES: TetR/AcrR family transcriptional regulator [Nocardia]